MANNWWTISADDRQDMNDRMDKGEDPEMVLIEQYANDGPR